MSYFGVSTRNGVGLGLGTVPSLTNTPLSYRLAPSLELSFAGSTTLDPRITFSRTTNATETGSNGLIQWAPNNLLTFSEQFDNAAWAKTAATVAANNTAAPDGTLTADKLIADATLGQHRVNFTPTSPAGVQTLSVYAKAAEYSFVYLRIGTTGAGFSLINGSTFEVMGGVTATSTFVGNGWYRVSISLTAAANDIARINILTSAAFADFTGNGVDGIFIWGAQLELGSTATTYNSTTVKNLLGFTENFDNAAWTKSNAFVQTNQLLWSEQFNDAYWAKVASSVTANAVAAPNGSITAEKLVEDTATAQHYVTRAAADFVAGATYTLSVYAKASERQWVAVGFINESNRLAWFNLSTGVVGTVNSNISATSIQAVGDGWYRCVITSTVATTNPYPCAVVSNANGVASYAGDGTSGIFIWGAQLVQGATAGDYKATFASAAAVGYTDIYGQQFAQKLVENTANGVHSVSIGSTTIVGTLYTFSSYVKAAERSWCVVQLQSAIFAYVNLTTGAVGTTSGSPTVAVASVGNGWYRVSVTAGVTGTSSSAAVYAATGDGTVTYTGDGTSGILIFGAQLSDSASVDPYVYQPVAAPASTAYFGPRFDYDPVTLAPRGLLIEEQRTNLLLNSGSLSSVNFAGGVRDANQLVAPDGTLSASTVRGAGTVSNYLLIATATATTMTFTCFVRIGVPSTRTSFPFLVRNNTTATNFTAGTFSTVTGVITGAGWTSTNVGNGWFRIAYTNSGTEIITVGNELGLYFGATGASAYAATEVIGMWGAQLEAGAFATSYIPTGAAQVTRAADNASMIANNFARWYTQGPGTVFADTLDGRSPGRSFTISDASINNQIFSVFAVSEAQSVYTAGAFVVQQGTPSGTVNRIAGGYAANNFAVSVNGGAALVDTSGGIAASYTKMDIGQSWNSTAQFNGTIRRISYYNRRLSNTELQGLTS